MNFVRDVTNKDFKLCCDVLNPLGIFNCDAVCVHQLTVRHTITAAWFTLPSSTTFRCLIMFTTWFSQCSWQILVLTLVTIVHWLVTSDFMISLYTPVLQEQTMKLIQFYQHGDGTSLILGYITRILGRLCRRYHSQYLVIVVLWVVIILLIENVINNYYIVYNVSWICREWTAKTVNYCNYSYFV